MPPEHLLVRATANPDPKVFEQTGRRLAAIFASVVKGVVLDWGCGPGRVARWLNTQCDLHGCDIDAEAVTWCNQNIRAAYTHTGLVPPLPYLDESFDAVIACSVMTHLDRDLQKLWLPEIQRILKPGGTFAASVHGEPARAQYIPLLPGLLPDNGIFDEMVLGHLEGVAPSGYYRAVFQSEEWTRREWGSYFTVTDYREAGLTATQDLVICQK